MKERPRFASHSSARTSTAGNSSIGYGVDQVVFCRPTRRSHCVHKLNRDQLGDLLFKCRDLPEDFEEPAYLIKHFKEAKDISVSLKRKLCYWFLGIVEIAGGNKETAVKLMPLIFPENIVRNGTHTFKQYHNGENLDSDFDLPESQTVDSSSSNLSLHTANGGHVLYIELPEDFQNPLDLIKHFKESRDVSFKLKTKLFEWLMGVTKVASCNEGVVRELMQVVFPETIINEYTQAGEMEFAREHPGTKEAFDIVKKSSYSVRAGDMEVTKRNPYTPFALVVALKSPIVTDDDKELAKIWLNTFFAFSLTQNEHFEITEDDKDFARANPESDFAFGLTQNPKFKIEPKDLNITQKFPFSRFAAGIESIKATKAENYKG